jgi:hypothetical protein
VAGMNVGAMGKEDVVVARAVLVAFTCGFALGITFTGVGTGLGGVVVEPVMVDVVAV